MPVHRHDTPAQRGRTVSPTGRSCRHPRVRTASTYPTRPAPTNDPPPSQRAAGPRRNPVAIGRARIRSLALVARGRRTAVARRAVIGVARPVRAPAHPASPRTARPNTHPTASTPRSTGPGDHRNSTADPCPQLTRHSCPRSPDPNCRSVGVHRRVIAAVPKFVVNNRFNRSVPSAR